MTDLIQSLEAKEIATEDRLRVLSQEDKLFFNESEATFTFLHENRVVCLHFDGMRQSIFLNGHRISHLNDEIFLMDYLAAFKKALLAEGVGRALLRAFDIQVSEIFRTKPEATL